jgi:hypothetical protein
MPNDNVIQLKKKDEYHWACSCESARFFVARDGIECVWCGSFFTWDDIAEAKEKPK